MIYEPVYLTTGIILLFLVWKVFQVLFSYTKWKRHKNIISTVATIIGIPLIHVASLFAWVLYVSYYPEKTFDMQAWKADTLRENRYKYSKNIVRSKILDGKSSLEILNLLGSPDHKYTDSLWGYNLGTRPGFHIDPDYLEIYFQNEKVIQYKIMCEGKVECY